MIKNHKKKFDYFGFKKIKKTEKTSLVNKIFYDIANNYDLMNDIMSFGIHRLWKYYTVRYSKIKYGDNVLDVAGGTADLTKKISYIVGKIGKVILIDINNEMIEQGRNKLRNQGIVNNVYYVQGNAEYLPFPDNYFDCVTISFGLRNITNKEKALYSMWKVLKPGGKIIILEFSTPFFKSFLLNKIYDIYSFCIIPKIGHIITKNYQHYQYLVESIRMHPNQEELTKIMLSIGFKNVRYKNFTQGIVALHEGFKIF